MSARPVAVSVDDMNAHADIGFDDEPGTRPEAGLNSRVEAMTSRLGVLTKQNRQLLTSVSHLLDLYEAEKAQRLALQASMERLVEDLSAERPETAAANAAEEIRRGVSDDLRPLLHAIIDLVEISMRRTPTTAIAEAARPSSNPSGGREEPTRAQVADDDNLPQALPEILTKSVDELVAAAHGGRQENTGAGTAAAAPDSAAAVRKNGRGVRRHSVLPEATRGGIWIPVTSDKAQT